MLAKSKGNLLLGKTRPFYCLRFMAQSPPSKIQEPKTSHIPHATRNGQDVTFDASGLETYFSPTEDVEISFDHLFGLEKFDEWVGSATNDGAGIFTAMTKGPESHYTDGAIPLINLTKPPNGKDLSVNELATKRHNGVAVRKYYDPNPLCADMNWQYDGSIFLLRTKDIKLIAGMNYYIGIKVTDA